MHSAVVRQLLASIVALTMAPSAIIAAQQGEQQAARPPDSASTTQSDRTDLSLAVYNSDLALVRDVRQVTLPGGAFSLRFGDVATSVNTAAVHLRSLTEPAALAVLEQHYEYDLLDPDRLLRKYIGREVTLVRDRQENGTTKAEEVKALLLAYNNAPVWKIGNEIVTGRRVDEFRFPELPETLFSRPTLVWLLDNRGAKSHRIEASYLTAGISWSADYVLTIARDDRSAEIAGWVTVRNNSGTAYQNAKLQLVAGEVRRAMEAMDKLAAPRAMAEAVAPPPLQRESFSEYHLYTLPRRTSVADRESKQIGLLAPASVPVEKRFVVDGQDFYYRDVQPPDAELRDPVKVIYRFWNHEKSGLGLPLPSGIVRVYQADSTGAVLFAGEQRISHTAKDERIEVHTGDAFDIACERRQTEFRRLSASSSEMAFEVTLRNHREGPVTIEVNEHFGGDWQLADSSQKWTKVDASTARFEVPVGKDGVSVLKYRVRIKR